MRRFRSPLRLSRAAVPSGPMNTLWPALAAIPFALLIACGSNPPAEPSTASTAAAKEPGGRKDHKENHNDHGDLPAPVKAFHDELSPLWHADKGADRTAKTCEKAGSLKEKAVATNDKDLVAKTDALVAECAKDGRPDFETKFADVHKQFHVLAKPEKK